jgi:hypothetical protein
MTDFIVAFAVLAILELTVVAIRPGNSGGTII